MRVDPVSTPADAATAAYALVRAGVPRDAVIGAVAHLFLENGSGMPYMWNNNPGNVKLTPTQKAVIGWDDSTRTAGFPDGDGSFDWFTLVDSQGGDSDPNPYRSYSDLSQGVKSYTFEIRRRPSVIAAMTAQDPTALSYALYTDDANGSAPGGFIGCVRSCGPGCRRNCTNDELQAAIAGTTRDLTGLITQVQASLILPPLYVMSNLQYGLLAGGAFILAGGLYAFARTLRR